MFGCSRFLMRSHSSSARRSCSESEHTTYKGGVTCNSLRADSEAPSWQITLVYHATVCTVEVEAPCLLQRHLLVITRKVLTDVENSRLIDVPRTALP